MKYYVYISDAKVDMLYPQIPQSLLKKIAASLNIDLKLLGAEVNIGAKGSPSDETRYAKVKIVSEYIEKHIDVGTIDAPSTYFKGKLLMKQGTLLDKAAYFGGETEQTVLGLCGSMKHLIGSPVGSDITTYGSSLYAIEYLVQAVVSEAKLIYNTTATKDYIEDDLQLDTLVGIVYITKGRPSHTQQFEFLAKTLLQGPFPIYNHPYVVLGTPIYVAIDD